MAGFADHFSGVARDYASFRPGYPAALFDWLAARAPARDLAWDCATGNGQAALALSRHFVHVVATDASEAQIAAAERHPRIEYVVAPAEDPGLEDASVDLLTVAQAAHWFDLERFHREAHRILRVGGLIAEWCYGIAEIDGASIDASMLRYYDGTVGPYWPPERGQIEVGYRDLPFPFRRIDPPGLAMEVEWTLAQWVGYVRTWSATSRFIEARGVDPTPELERQLLPLWGESGAVRRVRWPLALRVGRA
ncbi:MAG: hypothetical protein NAOJABEB_01330 [Steroidobacteraceae bacterium]|nr:hypothetical protein [Steroidobacteraceae bacterium]